jgi:hypothetical protein
MIYPSEPGPAGTARPRQIEKTRKPIGTAHQPAHWVFYQTPSDKVVIGAGYEN